MRTITFQKLAFAYFGNYFHIAHLFFREKKHITSVSLLTLSLTGSGSLSACLFRVLECAHLFVGASRFALLLLTVLKWTSNSQTERSIDFTGCGCGIRVVTRSMLISPQRSGSWIIHRSSERYLGPLGRGLGFNMYRSRFL